MAIDPNIYDGEDQYPEEESLEPIAPRTADTEAEHSGVMEELTPDAPPKDVPPEVREDHARVMSELTPPTPAPRVKPAEAQKQGRYYVPPKERTPETRAQRREQAQKRKEETGRVRESPGDAPTLTEFMEGGGALPEPSTSGGGGRDELLSVAEAFLRHAESSTSALTDLIRRVDQLTEAVERARL